MAKVIEMKGGWKSAADFNLQANRTPLYPPRVRRILSCRPVQFRHDRKLTASIKLAQGPTSS
jgi:hypothetical protein